MKKSLIAILILGSISFTFANYMVKVPLEQDNGGSLPSGSITLSKSATGTKPLKECKYDDQANSFVYDDRTGRLFFFWNSYLTYTINNDSLELNGYKYTKSTLVKTLPQSSYFIDYYEICREPI